MGTTIAYFAVFIILFGAMVYFLMIRPIKQREKQHDKMVDELEPGDVVITAGGIFGEIEHMDEGSVVIKVESGALLRVTKGGVIKRDE